MNCINKTIVFIGLLVCNSSCQYSSNGNGHITGKELGDHFFDFDELVHYRIDIDEITLLEKENDEGLSSLEQLQIDLIIMDFPHSITDTAFVPHLEDIGFTKDPIQSDQFDRVNAIFSEKDVEEYLENACSAVYRDLLIFKKNDAIIGMAKICFSCHQNRIYGTSSNTGSFGQEGDYGRLDAILNGT